jgi:hypothetical protein
VVKAAVQELFELRIAVAQTSPIISRLSVIAPHGAHTCFDAAATTNSQRRYDMHWLDPDYLPEVSGTFERFLINPHGDADGMILTDGTEIHFPPHMSAEVCAAIRPGEPTILTIRGVRGKVIIEKF